MSSGRDFRRFQAVGLASALVVVAVATTLAVSHFGDQNVVGKAAPRPSVWSAAVARARKGPPARTLDVQGEARPFSRVTLYAKVSGYLRAIPVDRGDQVTKDQVLAVIQSPEIDRQQQAALADAAHKRANARSAAALTRQGAISIRQVEAESASADMAEAVLAGIRTQKSFAILRAPFNGTVTGRFADPGALVQNAANAQSGALPLVTISETSRLRVHAYVDQSGASLVRLGDRAEITVPDSATTIAASVSRINGELDPRTRTMLVEIDLDNPERKIMPGSFVQVRLTVKSPAFVEIPLEALVIRDQKTFVALVRPSKRIELRSVSVGRFDGPNVGIVSGLDEGDLVALNVSRAVRDGDPVDPIATPPLRPASTGK